MRPTLWVRVPLRSEAVVIHLVPFRKNPSHKKMKKCTHHPSTHHPSTHHPVRPPLQSPPPTAEMQPVNLKVSPLNEDRTREAFLRGCSTVVVGVTDRQARGTLVVRSYVRTLGGHWTPTGSTWQKQKQKQNLAEAERRPGPAYATSCVIASLYIRSYDDQYC